MHLIRRLFRLIRLVPHVFRGLWWAAARLPRQPPPRTESEWYTVREWNRRALALFGVDAQVHGTAATGPALFVANHVSWLDIAGLASVLDASFIGKRELEHWPVLSFLITRGGTIYIDRGARGAVANVAEQMTQRLRDGYSVIIFPEGTTGTGDDIRRFHPQLFQAAQQAQVPVQPVALRYDSPVAAFVGNVPFLRHVWRVLGTRRLTLDVWLLPPISPHGLERRALARLAEQAVGDVVRGMPPAVDADPPPALGPTAHGQTHQE